ncbi:type II secretion system protein [Dasania marina]|uniref:PilW family protein n=1 Tax=Dasania marina TaxID=471499 RepID=UPI0030DB3170|tara:strand:- start:55877 stop:56692 length:816 start_codon:yes stop_codon:yes gene_type:complete
MIPAIKKAKGFTLVELVSVIVLLGLLSAGATIFIGDSVRIYNDSTRRAELTQQGRFAVERVSRELRNALPGSIRVKDECIEFAPIAAASSYLNFVADGHYAQLQAAGFTYTLGSNQRVAVHSIENKDVYQYNRKAVVDLGSVAGADTDLQRQVNFTNFTPPGHKFRSESNSKRFYIINEPVSFCVRNNELVRHDGYGWLQNQATDVATLGADFPLAVDIQLGDSGAVTPFTYTLGVLARSAVVHIDFRFSNAQANNEWVRFSHEVFVRNVP